MKWSKTVNIRAHPWQKEHKDTLSKHGKLPRGARRGNCGGGKADTGESMAWGGPSDLFWARSTAMRVTAGHQEMAKKVNSILQHGKGLLFLLRPTCYLLYMEKGQSMINSKVQNSSAWVQSTTAVHMRQSFLLIFNTQCSKSKKFSRKSTHKSLKQNKKIPQNLPGSYWLPSIPRYGWDRKM